MTKTEMLLKMSDCNWDHQLSEDSSYDDVKSEYDAMIDQLSYEENDNDDYLMYPNTRDYDAENID